MTVDVFKVIGRDIVEMGRVSGEMDIKEVLVDNRLVVVECCELVDNRL